MNNYKAEYDKAADLDEDVSKKVGAKNFDSRYFRTVLTSLLDVLRGNYPDDHKNAIRQWGFR